MNKYIRDSIDFASKQRLEMLRRRAQRCRCKYCGGKLVLRRLSFSSFEEERIEIFCSDCERIEFGVEPEIYANAKFFVEETSFNCFPDLDDNEKTKQMTIARVCEIMTWENQNIGILETEGFQIPLNMNEHYIGECITLSDGDLDKSAQ